MTKQESFKKRVRARMSKTGEKYGAARRALLEKAGSSSSGREWISEPPTTDEAMREATGKGYDAWVDIIEAWPGHTGSHGEIVAYLQSEFGVDGWWAQSVTVGYERITGLRLPYQRSDGTFAASKSRTVTLDPDELRTMLLSDEDRSDLFPDQETELRSKPTAKSLRVGIGPGTASFFLEPVGDDRVKVTVSHERLPGYEDAVEVEGLLGGVAGGY